MDNDQIWAALRLLTVGGVTAIALYAAKKAAVHGWVLRYLSVMLVVTVLLEALLASGLQLVSGVYERLYIALTAPLFVTIFGVMWGYAKKMPVKELLIAVFWSSMAVGVALDWSLSNYPAGAPDRALLALGQFAFLGVTGTLTLAGSVYDDDPQRGKIGRFLGFFWCGQAGYKLLTASAFVWLWPEWRPVNMILSSAIVCVGMAGLIRLFYLIPFEMMANQLHKTGAR